MKNISTVEFEVDFRTIFGHASATRSAKISGTPEQTFKEILKSLPLTITRTWEHISFELEGKQFDISEHHLVETNFNFELSAEITEDESDTEIICEFTGKLCTEDTCSDECDDFENEEEEEETENTCEYCGEICEGDFCNKNHKKAYFLD